MSENQPLQKQSEARTERQNFLLACSALLLLVCFTYANHFQNSFHFDDFHCVSENPYIRDLRNVPKFFTDGSTFSTLPSNRSYRPLVSTGLAIDYWLGHGLNPFWFHVTTFVWFLTQLGLMFTLFRATLERIAPGPRSQWLALLGAALYGVHPAIAETVNYVIQRSDIYSTLGVVAGMAIYARRPGLRKYGVYLLPVVAGIFSKPPAVVFPALLFAWIRWFDQGDGEEASLLQAAGRTAPAALVCGFLAWFTAEMNPPTFVAGGQSPLWYRLTQPFILLRYFGKFLVPAGLSADTDLAPFTAVSAQMVAGWIFVAAAAAFVCWCAFGAGRTRKELRPVAFGLFWFLVASFPTSWIALAEVENDHRLYFPFVGLTLAACQAGLLLWERRPLPAKYIAAACAVLLLLLAAGTRERNRVWHDDDSLWKDVTEKSPKNGRGLMNYGLTLLAKGDNAGALDLFTRALVYTPNYYILEINLGIAYGALGKPAEANAHFTRSIALAPGEVTPRYYYARFQYQNGQPAAAAALLAEGVRLNPDYLPAWYLLMETEGVMGDRAALEKTARDTLARFPGDATAAAWLERSPRIQPGAAAQAAADPRRATADQYLNESLAAFRAGQFQQCVDLAKKATELTPDYAAAWNNVGSCSNSLEKWDDGIQALLKALQLKPDFQLAKNNLAWAHENKAKSKK